MVHQRSCQREGVQHQLAFCLESEVLGGCLSEWGGDHRVITVIITEMAACESYWCMTSWLRVDFSVFPQAFKAGSTDRL